MVGIVYGCSIGDYIIRYGVSWLMEQPWINDMKWIITILKDTIKVCILSIGKLIEVAYNKLVAFLY